MNKLRRKAISKLYEQLEEILAAVEDILAEEEEAKDNIPESLWETERYEMAEAAVENLESAVESINEALEYLESAAE